MVCKIAENGPEICRNGPENCRKQSGNLQKIVQNIAEAFLRGGANYLYLYGTPPPWEGGRVGWIKGNKPMFQEILGK